MKSTQFEVIIIGGSYAGLAAAMALGRALRKVLVVDSGQPCNRHTPYSHNFLTRDGFTPSELASIAKQQVSKYNTVGFLDDVAVKGELQDQVFHISTESGETVSARKLIFATGVKDILPDIPGFAECWGKSVIHCPYCHGYEVRNERTGILANGDAAFEYAALVYNWTKELTIYTNGKSQLTSEQTSRLSGKGINVVEWEVSEIVHADGSLKALTFSNGKSVELKALYSRPPFTQHTAIPQSLGCALTEDGYLKVDAMQGTTVAGIFACGDNTMRMRAVANAVASGTAAGISTNRELISESF